MSLQPTQVQRLKEALKNAAIHLEYVLETVKDTGILDDEETKAERDYIIYLKELAND